MDERKTTGPTESTAEQPQSEGRRMLEQAFARGSGHISDGAPVAVDRTEHSVMEGLPPAKAERIAAMRRELAELQRQLSDAQQRIAKEAQARAEDAERFEASEDALEARLQAQEGKTQAETARTAELTSEIANLKSQLSIVSATTEELRRDVAARDTQIEEARQQHRGVTEQLEAKSSSLTEAKTLLTEAKTLLETRDRELATRTAERDTEQATKSRLERELEAQREQHGEVSTQLESHVVSLRDATTLIATRNTELAAITSERDALKGEIAANRAKARDVANQLTRLAFDLAEGGEVPAESSSEPPAVPARSAERSKPPPLPQSRAAAPTEPPKVEAIIVTEEPKSKSRIGLALIGGVLLGCVATFAFVKLTSASTTADQRQDLGASSSAALAPERPSEPTSPAATGDQPVAAPGTAPAQPTPVSNPDVTDRPKDESESRPTAPGEINTNGVIVLPQEAEDHRVFVDGKVVPVKNSRAVVPCGTREIRIGSRGTPRTLDIACGAETTVPADTSDR